MRLRAARKRVSCTCIATIIGTELMNVSNTGTKIWLSGEEFDSMPSALSRHLCFNVSIGLCDEFGSAEASDVTLFGATRQ